MKRILKFLVIIGVISPLIMLLFVEIIGLEWGTFAKMVTISIGICILSIFGLIFIEDQDIPIESDEETIPTYEDLLKSYEWEEKRQQILKRDNYQCQWCKTNNKLQIHHRYYSKYPNNEYVLPWNYPNEAFMTLCDNCHKKLHSKYKIFVYYRSYNE